LVLTPYTGSHAFQGDYIVYQATNMAVAEANRHIERAATKENPLTAD